MLSELQKSKVSRIIDGKVISKEVFNAYGITKAIRLSEDCLHGDVRDYVSQLMQEYIKLDEYKIDNNINTVIRYVPTDYINIEDVDTTEDLEFNIDYIDLQLTPIPKNKSLFFIKSKGRFNIPLKFFNKKRLYGLKNKDWTLFFDNNNQLLITDKDICLDFLTYDYEEKIKKYKKYKLEMNRVLRFSLKSKLKDIYALEFIDVIYYSLLDTNIFIFKILKHKDE